MFFDFFFRRPARPSAARDRAQRRPAAGRMRDRRVPLGGEPLESRLAMSANVVVGTEPARGSQPLVRLLDVSKGTVVAETLAFESTFQGGTRVAMGDVDGNGDQEVLVASGPGRRPEIRVFDIRTTAGKTKLVELPAYRTYPFDAKYTGGITVACGDIDGNGRGDIVTSMSRGQGVVKAFLSVAPVAPANDPVSNVPYVTITPAPAGFDGGSAVAVGDFGTFTGGTLVTPGFPDGKVEIVVSSGVDAPPKVEVYDVSVRSAPRVVTTLQPFSPSVRWGLTVSTGRLNDDAIDDIIVSAGRHAGMKSVIYDGTPGSTTLLATFGPNGTPARPNAPAYAAPIDVNGDGKIDNILVAQGDPGGVTALFNTRVGNASPATTVKLPNIPGPLRIATARRSFQTLPSGLLQQDIVQGTGATPVAGGIVVVQYAGYLADGRVFEGPANARMLFQLPLPPSKDNPNGVKGLIPGFYEGLSTMKVGGIRLLRIPANLAYGAAGNPKLDADKAPLKGPDNKTIYTVPPDSLISYYVVLLQAVPPTPAPKA